MSPQRIQLRRTKGWRKPEGMVVVARPSKWGNPFPVGKDFSRHEAVRLYEDLIVRREAVIRSSRTGQHRYTRWHSGWSVPTIEHVRRDLAGRDLACWCPLDQPCHADVLLRLANEPPA